MSDPFSWGIPSSLVRAPRNQQPVLERRLPENPASVLELPDSFVFSRRVLGTVLHRVMDLPDSAIVVIADEKNVQVGARNNPTVDNRWFCQSIMSNCEHLDFTDWCKDGGVQVHPKCGVVLAVTGKFMPRDSAEWTLPEAQDGGTGGSRVKTALYLSLQHKCVVLVWKKKARSIYEEARRGWLSVFTSCASAKCPPEFFRVQL